jgi:hypothetical protein
MKTVTIILETELGITETKYRHDTEWAVPERLMWRYAKLIFEHEELHKNVEQEIKEVQEKVFLL